jgi:hypothetical protein
MTGAKSKTSKLSYTTVTTPSTSYTMTIPSAPSHGLGVSMTPPPGHPMPTTGIAFHQRHDLHIEVIFRSGEHRGHCREVGRIVPIVYRL